MQTGRSRGHTEGKWVHSSSSRGGGGEGGKDTDSFPKAEWTGDGFRLTGAASVLIQSKAVATLQHSRSG